MSISGDDAPLDSKHWWKSMNSPESFFVIFLPAFSRLSQLHKPVCRSILMQCGFHCPGL